MRIAIIGAGHVGLATAVTLADRGHTVTLIDPHPASGATHHAGGMLAPAAEVVYQQEALFPLMHAAGQWYPELVELISTHTTTPTGYQTHGTLVIAADRADAQHVQQLRDYQNAHGMAVEQITTRQARHWEPALSSHIAGAVSIPGDHRIYPRHSALAMLDAARAMGVELVEQHAHGITETAMGVSVHLPGRDINADQVVLANGLGAAQLLPQPLVLPLRPVYGDILRLRVPEHQRPMLQRVIRGFVEDRPVYIIPRPDGTLAIGATSREDGRADPQAGGVYELLRDAIRLVPGIEDCDFLEATAGARPGTPDDLPYLGRLPRLDRMTGTTHGSAEAESADSAVGSAAGGGTGTTVGDAAGGVGNKKNQALNPRDCVPQSALGRVIVSTGYFRHGILLTALGARVTAELVEGTPPSVDIAACHPLRFCVRDGAGADGVRDGVGAEAGGTEAGCADAMPTNSAPGISQ